MGFAKTFSGVNVQMNHKSSGVIVLTESLFTSFTSHGDVHEEDHPREFDPGSKNLQFKTKRPGEGRDMGGGGGGGGGGGKQHFQCQKQQEEEEHGEVAAIAGVVVEEMVQQ